MARRAVHDTASCHSHSLADAAREHFLRRLGMQRNPEAAGRHAEAGKQRSHSVEPRHVRCSGRDLKGSPMNDGLGGENFDPAALPQSQPGTASHQIA